MICFYALLHECIAARPVVEVRCSFPRYDHCLVADWRMPRITIAVNDEDHRALKLLGLLENKNLGTVLIEAVRVYLRQKGAYDLDVTSTKP